MDGQQARAMQDLWRRYLAERPRIAGMFIGRVESALSAETARYRAGQKCDVSKNLLTGKCACKMQLTSVEFRIFNEDAFRLWGTQNFQFISRLLLISGGMGLCLNMPDMRFMNDFLDHVNASLSGKNIKVRTVLKFQQKGTPWGPRGGDGFSNNGRTTTFTRTERKIYDDFCSCRTPVLAASLGKL